MAKEMGEWSAGKSRMLGTYRSNKLWTGERFFFWCYELYWMRKKKLHRLVNSKNSHPWSFEKIRLILKFLWPQPQGFLFAMSVWRVPHRLLQVTDSIIDPVLPSEMHTWTPLTFWSRARQSNLKLLYTVIAKKSKSGTIATVQIYGWTWIVWGILVYLNFKLPWRSIWTHGICIVHIEQRQEQHG